MVPLAGTMAQENTAGVSYPMALKNAAEPAAAPAREDTPEAGAVGGNAQRTYQGAEKRRSTRYNCEGRIELCEVGCDARTWASFTDISLYGCYVEAQATYPVGTSLRMKLEINSHKIETPGTVRVNYPYVGMGIAFGEMTDENRAQLKAVLISIMRPAVVMGPGIASSLPTRGPMESVPLISDPGVALQALIDFFENKQTLMREDFLRVLHQSQKGRTKP